MAFIRFFMPYVKFIVLGVLFYSLLHSYFKHSGIVSINAFVLLFLLSTFSALWVTKYNFLSIIGTNLLATGSVMFLLTIGKNNIQKHYIIFVSLLFVISLLGSYKFFSVSRKESESELVIAREEDEVKLLDSGFSLTQSVAMFTIFLLSSGIYGVYMIIGMSVWQMMLLIFISIYLTSYYLIKINFIKSQELGLWLDYYKNRTFNFYAFLMGLIMLELTWAMSFLPINHLTFGAVILATYFSFWSIIKSYLRNELTRVKFMYYVLVLWILILCTLFTSKLSLI